MELTHNMPTGETSDALSTSYTGRAKLSSGISGKRAEYSRDRASAETVPNFV